MSTVNVTELRRNLPTYLKKVQSGQCIRVTSRGRVIAELAPPAATADSAAEARKLLKGSVRHYEQPFEPAVPIEEWNIGR